MPEKLRNIIEDIARDFLNSALTLRYDICTCPQCRNDMLAHILSNIPAKYVTTEEGAIYTIVQQTRVEHQAEISRAILKAIEIIGNNPRHKLKENKAETFRLLLEKYTKTAISIFAITTRTYCAGGSQCAYARWGCQVIQNTCARSLHRQASMTGFSRCCASTFRNFP